MPINRTYNRNPAPKNSPPLAPPPPRDEELDIAYELAKWEKELDNKTISADSIAQLKQLLKTGQAWINRAPEDLTYTQLISRLTQKIALLESPSLPTANPKYAEAAKAFTPQEPATTQEQRIIWAKRNEIKRLLDQLGETLREDHANPHTVYRYNMLKSASLKYRSATPQDAADLDEFLHVVKAFAQETKQPSQPRRQVKATPLIRKITGNQVVKSALSWIRDNITTKLSSTFRRHNGGRGR